MEPEIKVDLLKNHPAHLPTIARWCAAEWPEYYNGGNFESAHQYHLTTLQDSTIPCGMVALSGDRLIGTISLLEEDMSIRPQYAPWLGCLYVDPHYRGRAVAQSLINFATELAKVIGLTELYAWTHKMASFMERLEWAEIERVDFLGDEAVILRRDLCSGAKDRIGRR